MSQVGLDQATHYKCAVFDQGKVGIGMDYTIGLTAPSATLHVRGILSQQTARFETLQKQGK